MQRKIIIPAQYIPTREVLRCFECPHYREHQGEFMDSNECEYNIWGDTPRIVDPDVIPNWCPLLV